MAKKILEDILEINDIEFPNKGIGYFNQEKVYIKNVIPNQKVRVSIKL